MAPGPSETFSFRSLLLSWVARDACGLASLLPGQGSQPVREVPTRLSPSLSSEASKDAWNPSSQKQNSLVCAVVHCSVKQFTNFRTKIVYLNTGDGNLTSLCMIAGLCHFTIFISITLLLRDPPAQKNDLFITETSQRPSFPQQKVSPESKHQRSVFCEITFVTLSLKKKLNYHFGLSPKIIWMPPPISEWLYLNSYLILINPPFGKTCLKSNFQFSNLWSCCLFSDTLAMLCFCFCNK